MPATEASKSSMSTPSMRAFWAGVKNCSRTGKVDDVLITSSTMKSEGTRMVMVVRPDPSDSFSFPALDEDWLDITFTPSGGAKWMGIASVTPSAFRLASSGGESSITYVDRVRLPPAPPVAAAAFLLAARAACSIKEVLFDAEPTKIRITQVRVARLRTQRKGKAH